MATGSLECGWLAYALGLEGLPSVVRSDKPSYEEHTGMTP